MYTTITYTALVSSFFISIAVNYYFIYQWKNKSKSFIDYPDSRKSHKCPTLLLGGVGIYSSFTVIDLFFNWIPKGILIGGAVMFLTGLLDDYLKGKKIGLSVLGKSIGISLSIVISYIFDVRITSIYIPFLQRKVTLDVTLQFILTFIWFFAIVTFINFLDGLDGLAGTVSVIVLVSFMITSFLEDNLSLALVCILSIFSILGFLVFNVSHAKIFMGDSGALFIGYLLAVISIQGYLKTIVFQTSIIPVIALALPIFDNIYVFIQRLSKGKKIYQADRLQSHLKMQDMGYSKEQTYITLVLITLFFSIVATAIAVLEFKKR